MIERSSSTPAAIAIRSSVLQVRAPICCHRWKIAHFASYARAVTNDLDQARAWLFLLLVAGQEFEYGRATQLGWLYGSNPYT